MSAFLAQHRAALRSTLRRLFALAAQHPPVADGHRCRAKACRAPAGSLWTACAASPATPPWRTADQHFHDHRRQQEGGQRNRVAPARHQSGSWRLVPKDEALKRLQSSEGMAEIIASLPRNPLPDAYVVEPRDTQPESMEQLAKTFSDWPKVAHVQLDSAWVKRFDAFLRIGKLSITLLGSLFAGALVAVASATIRLQILAQAAEIEVAKLIGATDAFIRRPFRLLEARRGARRALCRAARRRGQPVSGGAGRRTGRPLWRQLCPARFVCSQYRGVGGDRCGARLAGRTAVGRHPSASHWPIAGNRENRIWNCRKTLPGATLGDRLARIRPQQQVSRTRPGTGVARRSRSPAAKPEPDRHGCRGARAARNALLGGLAVRRNSARGTAGAGPARHFAETDKACSAWPPA